MRFLGWLRRDLPARAPERLQAPLPRVEIVSTPPRVEVVPPSNDGRWPIADIVQGMLYNGASWEAVIWTLRGLDTVSAPVSPAVTGAVTEADSAAAAQALDRLRRKRARDAAYKREKRARQRELRLVSSRPDVTRRSTAAGAA